MKITESYKQYYDFSPKCADTVITMLGAPAYEKRLFPVEKYPTEDSIMYQNKTLYILRDNSMNVVTFSYKINIHGIFTNDITYINTDPVDKKIVFVDKNTGDVNPLRCGKTDISIENKYGSDKIHVVVLYSAQKYMRIAEE